MEETDKTREEEATAPPAYTYRSENLTDIYTKLLGRNVEIEIMIPPQLEAGKKYPLLELNDGQDSEAVKVKNAIAALVQEKEIPEIIVVGIKAADRMQEYGVAFRADYFGRGKFAKAYSDYVVTELMPYLKYKYPLADAPSTRAM